MNTSELAKLIEYTKQKNVKLVAISKTVSTDEILEAYKSGQKVFGENKVQEIASKQAQLPSDIEWHMVGTLQTNKVKYIAPFVQLIHSVDSLKLAIAINKEALKYNRVIDVLLEVCIAAETTKHGFSEEEILELIEINSFQNLKNIRIVGLMGMATYTKNKVLIKNEFAHLKDIFDNLKSGYFSNKPEFKEISMGMSGDYELAMEKGSTMVRIGSAIFGERIRKRSANVPM